MAKNDKLVRVTPKIYEILLSESTKQDRTIKKVLERLVLSGKIKREA